MDRQTCMQSTQRSRRVFKLFPAIAILIAGCSSNLTGVAAAAGQKMATYVSSKALPSRMSTAPIMDASMGNMLAVTMMIPAGWTMQGIEMQPPCTPSPFPVFRAQSPDGLMQLRQEPTLGWKWGSGTRSSQDGCLTLPRSMSAADFLQYYVSMMEGGVHVVGDMAVPEGFSDWAQKIARQADEDSRQLPPVAQAKHSGDTAALRVQVINGSFVVEERLWAAVICGVNTTPSPWMPGLSGGCFARVDVLAAPAGKLDALVQLADANDLPHWTGNPQWRHAVQQAISDKRTQMANAFIAAGRAESAASSARLTNAFRESMARSASQHAAFMQQQESSFRSSMNAANNAMNARTTAASDWVDYALDQQTVTGSGGTVKVSSAYSHTWSNGQGQWYQTNDPNANPNGVLYGSWTQTTVVHGNGQPK